ncbi:MAG: GNAT family N-acetyltransferase [Pseudomonadota bacterium]
MQPLVTRRLILRPIELSDFESLCLLYGDVEVMKYVTGKPRTREKTQQRLAAHVKQHTQFGFGLCAAISKNENRFIGRCGLEPRLEPRGLSGELAWMFVPSYWGKGLATESAKALIQFAKARLEIHRIFATADHRNIASIAIMKKLGMSLVREDSRGVEYEIIGDS